MIVHTIYNISLPPNALGNIRSLTTTPYSSGTKHIQTYTFQNWPEIQLMEGGAVPAHNDGIDGYRPLLILANPSNNYILRGVGQQLQSQRPGTLIVLNIGKEHEVHDIDPAARHGPWSALVWGPNALPCLKKAWAAERVMEIAVEMFEEFLRTIGGNQ